MTNLYFGDPNMDFQNGVRLELRAKLSIEFAKAIACTPGVADIMSPAEVAEYARKLVVNLIHHGETAGWVRELSDSDVPDEQSQHHFNRQTHLEVARQLHGNKVGRELSDRVQEARPAGIMRS